MAAAASKIAVEITAESAGLQEAVTKAADSLKGLADVVAKTAKAASSSGGDIVKSNRALVDSFGTVGGAAKESSATVGKAAGAQADAVAGSAAKIAASSKGIGASMDGAAVAGVVASGKLVGAAKKADAGIGAAWISAGKKTSEFGRSLSSVSLPIAAIGAVSVDMAAKFQSSMEKLRTQAGYTQAQVDSLSKGVLAISPSIAQTPDAIAQGLYHIASVGIPAGKALDVVKAAAIGANIGGANFEDVANLLATTMKNYPGIMGGAAAAMGILNGIVGAGNIRMSELSTSLGQVIPTAKGAGLGLRDVGAAIDVMTSHGIPAQMAVTRLRMALSLMEAPTAKARGALAAIGITQSELANDMRQPNGLLVALDDLKSHLAEAGATPTQTAQLLSDAFGGARSGAGILALIQNTGQYADILTKRLPQGTQAVKDLTAAQAAWDQTTQGQFDHIKAALAVTAIELGQALIPVVVPALKELAGIIESLAHDFEGLPGPVRSFIVAGLGIAALASPFILIGGKVLTLTGHLLNLAQTLSGAVASAFRTAGTEAETATPKIAGAGDAAATTGTEAEAMGTKAATATPEVATLGTTASTAGTSTATLGTEAVTAGAGELTLGTDAATATPEVAGLGVAAKTALPFLGAVVAAAGMSGIAGKYTTGQGDAIPATQLPAGSLGAFLKQYPITHTPAQLAAFVAQWDKTHGITPQSPGVASGTPGGYGTVGGVNQGMEDIANLAQVKSITAFQPSSTQASAAINKVAAEYGVSPQALIGIYGAESGYGSNENTSSAGAMGPFQFMPGTAAEYGISGQMMEFGPELIAAAQYLKKAGANSVLNSPQTLGAISAYNPLNGGYNAGYVSDVLAHAEGLGSSSGSPTSAPPTNPGAQQSLAQYLAGTKTPSTATSLHYNWQDGQYEFMTATQYKQLQEIWNKTHPREAMPTSPAAAKALVTKANAPQAAVTALGKVTATNATTDFTHGQALKTAGSSITGVVQSMYASDSKTGTSVLGGLKDAISSGSLSQLKTQLNPTHTAAFDKIVTTLDDTHKKGLVNLATQLKQVHKEAMEKEATLTAAAAEAAYEKLVSDSVAALTKRSTDLGTLYGAGAVFGVGSQTGQIATNAQEAPLVGGTIAVNGQLPGLLQQLIPQLEAGSLSTGQAANWASVFAGGALGQDFSALASGKLNATDTASTYDSIYSLIGSLGSLQTAVESNTTATVDNSQLVSLLQEQNATLSQRVALQAGQTSVLKAFIPNIPHFASGGPVINDGLIYAHKNEWVLPANRGATSQGGPGMPGIVHVHNHIHGNADAFIDAIDSRIAHPDNMRAVSSGIGGRTRMLAGAPGGWRS